MAMRICVSPASLVSTRTRALLPACRKSLNRSVMLCPQNGISAIMISGLTRPAIASALSTVRATPATWMSGSCSNAALSPSPSNLLEMASRMRINLASGSTVLTQPALPSIHACQRGVLLWKRENAVLPLERVFGPITHDLQLASVSGSLHLQYVVKFQTVHQSMAYGETRHSRGTRQRQAPHQFSPESFRFFYAVAQIPRDAPGGHTQGNVAQHLPRLLIQIRIDRGLGRRAMLEPVSDHRFADRAAYGTLPAGGPPHRTRQFTSRRILA